MKAIALAVRSPICHSRFRCSLLLHAAGVPARLLCALSNGAGGQSGAGRRLCQQQHRGGNFGAVEFDHGGATLLLVFRRCLATPVAPTTVGRVFARSLAIPPASSTPPRACKRSTATRSARKTRPLGLMRSLAIPPPVTIRPMARVRCSTTRPARKIQLPVSMPFLTTPPVRKTRPLG